uniref:Glycine N-acyltransferase-like protein n=1 Tax=Chelydra serpentina TaxID=8475 RepID=A0A8C3S402_CHESE
MLTGLVGQGWGRCCGFSGSHLLVQTLPGLALVYGTVMHVNRGNPASQEVLVDSWPEFKIVLTRPHREVAWDPSDYGTNLYTAFYRDEGACRALLGNSRAVDWGQAFQIQGEPFQPSHLSPQPGRGWRCRTLLPSYATSYQLNFCSPGSLSLVPGQPPRVPFPCLCWFYPPTPPPALTAPPPLARSIPSVLTPPHLSLPPALCFRPENGLRLAPVSPAHAKLLSDTWMFGGNSWSLRYLCLLIRHFPNACLLAPEGPPISWSLTDPLAALTHGYTLPEHRGQRHTGSVVGMLAAQLHARGFPVYTRVLPHNEPSLHTLKRLGFRELSCQPLGSQGLVEESSSCSIIPWSRAEAQ